MKNVIVNGVNLFYDKFGSGEPLVLIHGIGEHKEGWRCQYDLADQYDLIIPDLRGFGKTELGDDKNPSIEIYARDILALLDHLNIQKAHICGLSMGGIIAQELYRINRDKVQSLVLANSLSYVPKWLGNWILKQRKKDMENLSYQEYKLRATKACLYSKDEAIINETMQIWSNSHEGLLPAWQACANIDYRKLLPEIDTPTLIIANQKDKICRVFNQKQMYKKIPNSNYVLIKKAGHVGKIEKREAFNQAILSFLQKHPIQVDSIKTVGS
ncbi:alpha/beta fold hydrolase [Bacillus seohaeanensis]|uniref:Alpha/beta fold hydrolase n=1 Tax=Bacillus seohaeanensis TaxID=284580 RepID=A0ABW5RVE5_9BACI